MQFGLGSMGERNCLAALGIAAVFIGLSCGASFSSQSAFAQTKQTDADLIRKLDQLTRRKGYKSFAIGETTCRGLGLQPIGDCEVFQAPYGDYQKPGGAHAFNTFDEPGTGQLRIIMFKRVGGTTYAYLAGLDGRLTKAGRRDKFQETDRWAAITVDHARTGFQQELDYWRAKQDELSNEADRCSERWRKENPQAPKGQC